MRKLENTLKLCGLAAALMVSTAVSHAQIPLNDLNFYLTLNERGYGAVIGAASVLGSDPFVLTTSLTGHDSLSGMNTVMYTTPPGFSVTSGDIVLCDPSGPIGPDGIFSDVIRVRGSIQNANIFFFSSDIGGGDPADVGLPAVLQANVVYLAEGPTDEAAAGALWEPQAGQPGYIPYAAQNNFTYGYSIISVVPEPSSLALLGLAGGLAVLHRKRR